MKANELRIGNLVKYSDKDLLFTVTEISQAGIGVENEIEETWIELDSFEPIPLTEEWLLKFGFEKIGVNFHLNNFCIWFKLIHENYWFRYDNQGIEIKYVHQLQNLFYCLCGEELTLKP